MKEFPIPVVAFGPGSQPDAEEANFLPMPHDMHTFSMPVAHLEADPQTLAAACELLGSLRSRMLETPAGGRNLPAVDLAGVAPAVVELINQSLGHGEVSILGQGARRFRIQETIFAGVWRLQELSPQETLQRDAITAGAIPSVVQQAADSAAMESVSTPPLRDGMMNAPAILNELQERSRAYSAGDLAHVINLSLLPMSEEDLNYLGEALGIGPVTILSRGYGNCRISSTQLAHVWWVQYFNSMDQLILNTLEVVDVPEVAQAAEEDYADSIERLGEWLAVMQEETA